MRHLLLFLHNFFRFHTFQGHNLVALFDAHDDDALDITLVNIDGGSGNPNNDAAVFDQHDIVILAHHTAAGYDTGLGSDVIVLQALTTTALGDLLPIGASAQVLRQFGALTEAIDSDGKQGLALFRFLSAHNVVSIG